MKKKKNVILKAVTQVHAKNSSNDPFKSMHKFFVNPLTFLTMLHYSWSCIDLVCLLWLTLTTLHVAWHLVSHWPSLPYCKAMVDLLNLIILLFQYRTLKYLHLSTSILRVLIHGSSRKANAVNGKDLIIITDSCDYVILSSPLHPFLLCRIQRDVACRGRDVAGVIGQYTRFVKPAFDNYVAPSRRNADVIIPWMRYLDFLSTLRS